MRIVATAPAKLFLVGEYAVVEGAPALVAAIDRRVRVELADRDGPGWAYRTDADGGVRRTLHLDDAGRLIDDAGRLAELDPTTKLLAIAVADCRGDAPPPLPSGLEVRLESRDLHAEEAGHKLGLGSSAAVLVALGAALRRLGARDGSGPAPTRDQGLAWDLAAHRRLQAGRGSGADVAASTYGGVIRYERDGATNVRCRSVAMPPGLHMRCFWTGRSARTGDFLARAEACRARTPTVFQAHMQALGGVARQAADAFEKANTTDFLAACARYAVALGALGDALGAPIVSEPHRALSVLATRAGAVYKPSGAGGGDVGVALGVDPDGLERMAGDAAEAGYPTLTIGIDPNGVETLER